MSTPPSPLPSNPGPIRWLNILSVFCIIASFCVGVFSAEHGSILAIAGVVFAILGAQE